MKNEISFLLLRDKIHAAGTVTWKIWTALWQHRSVGRYGSQIAKLVFRKQTQKNNSLSRQAFPHFQITVDSNYCDVLIDYSR